jgi:hypothetical protein
MAPGITDYWQLQRWSLPAQKNWVKLSIKQLPFDSGFASIHIGFERHAVHSAP